MKYIYCEKIRRLPGIKSFSCCNSCHDDHEEYGYDLCYRDLGKGREGMFCCSCVIALDERDKP